MVRFSWPFGRVVLGTESITVDVLFRQFQIQFSQIERLEMGWMKIQVIHRAPGIPGWITISGWGLPGRLRKAIAAHNLPVPL